jgi:FlaA1/EpsC-like NDP-sugar epimerase
LIKVKAPIRNRYILLTDLLLIVISVLGSYALRLEWDATFFIYRPSLYWFIGSALLVKPVIYYLFGMYRRLWMYASVQDLKLIATAVTVASAAVSAVMMTLFFQRAFLGFPRSTLIIDWLLSLVTSGGIRFISRILAESQKSSSVQNASHPSKRILIVGAGDAGALVVREMQKNPQLNLMPVGFLDDNDSKQHQTIYGVPVVGRLSELAKVLDNKRVNEVIIAIPSAPGKIVRMVADVCRLKGAPFRTMPGIYELLGGKVNITRLREVDITDLLRREPTHVFDEQMGAVLTGKVVLVTGAGGSIGSEICRQIARWGPSELIMLGHGENSIFEAVLEMRELYPSVALHPVIADVRDLPRLENIFSRSRPQVVFHAAAHKHVPMMEMNIEEAITNNIQGTRNIVEVSRKFDVERLVMISTDKAIRPVNVMGATKRIAEWMVLDAANRWNRAFSVVRFGNVLGSRGSVVPLFKRQIASGGPVTVTHPDMKRYFMTIPEAVNLVLQAASMGGGGQTFVLNMGQQVRILDLAEDLIRLSGLEPYRDIEIIFTGIRPGEKLSEDLWDEGYDIKSTGHPDIFQISPQDDLQGQPLYRAVEELLKLGREGEVSAIIELLDEIIPGSAIRSTPPPEITAVN